MRIFGVAANAEADVKAGWKDVNEVVKAERAVYRKTGRYTDDWTTLKLANRELLNDADTYVGLEVELAEGRRGAIVTGDIPAGFALTAVMNGQRAERHCTAYGSEPCPKATARGGAG